MMAQDDLSGSRIRDRVLTGVDLAATFVLAAEAALAGVAADMDLFGILVLAYAGSVGGGVIRDLLLGEHPPAAFRDWRYAGLAILATFLLLLASVFWGPVGSLTPPLAVDLFEAIGLALAGVAGARKCMDYGLNGSGVAVIATANGCGGGIVRDLLINRMPHVLQQDFVATPVLAGAILMVLLVRSAKLPQNVAGLASGLLIYAMRAGALLSHWHLPHLR